MPVLSLLKRAAPVVLALAVTMPIGAQTAPKVAFTESTLANGLRVIIAEDHAAPVYSIVVHYKVGSRNEREGRTGFAHLFEHMMFKGSENVGPGEHFLLVFNNGGSMNGTTNKDRTVYFETLPSNQLDLGIFLEADRMRSLAITKDNLDNQRNAVQEERRLGVDNQPYGRTFEAVDELAYDNRAYEHSVIGSMTDLNAASVDDVASFFRMYYAPNNAVLAIVGDVDAKSTLEKVKKAFGLIPSQPTPPSVDMTEPVQNAERRKVIEDPLARLTRVDMVFKAPARGTPDDDAVRVLATVLGGGQSSRLYQQIVREQQLSPAVSASISGSIGPDLFRVMAMVAPGKTPEAVEAAVYAEIGKVASGPVADWEVEKARNLAKRSVVGGLTSSLTRAILLADYAAAEGDPGRINGRIDRIARVTAADVQRVARTYLTPENRTVVTTVPKAATAPKGGQ
jgi:zinc protease